MQNVKIIMILMISFMVHQTSLSQVVFDQKTIKNFDQYKEIVFVLPSEDQATNDLYKNTINEYFKLEMKYSFKKEKEAYKYWRKNKKSVLLAEIVRKLDTSTMLRETIFNVIAKKRVLKLYLRDVAFGMEKKDIYYAVQYLQYLVSNSDGIKSSNSLKDLSKINGKRLESKTLLVLESQLKDVEGFKSDYPFKFKVVKEQELNDAIFSNSKEFLYLYKANMSGDVSALLYSEWRIMDAHDGALVSWCSSGVKDRLSSKEIKFMLKKAKR